jgi:NADH-quinone oxidoreductase subunit J
MTELDPVFLVVAAFTIIAAIVALEAREVVYGAISLALTFLGVAGVYALLDAPYVALFQIIVYVGAIAVLIIFTVMLVARERWKYERPPVLQRAAGLLMGLLVALALGFVALAAGLDQVVAQEGFAFTLQDLGVKVVGDFSVAFVALALVLTASIIGALTLAKKEE